jgi:3-hydroxybutyryl-CoA dehydrogenase
MAKRRTIMGTPVTDPAYRDAAHGPLGADGTGHGMPRQPRLTAQRIVAMIVTIGHSIAQSRTAGPADIDKAVMLGLNYPNGLFPFGDILGPTAMQVLSSMCRIYGDRVTPILATRRAKLGVSPLTPNPKSP